MTEWERQKEQEEFSRAAKVFQPLVSSLSSRFTRATDQETAEEGRLSEKPTERPLVSVSVKFNCGLSMRTPAIRN